MLGKPEKGLGVAGVIALGLICSGLGKETDLTDTSLEDSSDHVGRGERGREEVDLTKIMNEDPALDNLVKEYRACMEQPLADVSEEDLKVSCREYAFKDGNRRKIGVEITCHAKDEEGVVASYITSYLGEASVYSPSEEVRAQVAYAGTTMYTDVLYNNDYEVPYFNARHEGIGDGNFLLKRDSDYGVTVVKDIAHFETFSSGLEKDRALSMCGDARTYLANTPTEDRVIELTEMVQDLADSLGLEEADVEVTSATERMSFDTQAGFLLNLDESTALACSAKGLVLLPIDHAELTCWGFEKQTTPSGETERKFKSFSGTIGKVFDNPQAFLDFAAPKE